MEHKDLWTMEEDVPADYTAEIGKARVVREGRDVTIVAWSKAVHVAAEAAKEAAKHDISAELRLRDTGTDAAAGARRRCGAGNDRRD